MKFPISTIVILALSSCTGAVAPEGTPESRSREAALEKRSVDLQNVTSQSQKPTNSGDPEPIDMGADDSIQIPVGNALGSVTSETGNLFTARSVYGVYDSASNSLNIKITENNERDTKFKKVLSWQCYDCKTTDSRCTETPLTDGYYILSFFKPTAEVPLPDVAAATNTGFPNKNSITLTGDKDADSFTNSGFTIFTASTSLNTAGAVGSILFDTRPAAVGDSFTFSLNVTLKSGKTHGATFTGKVFEEVTGSEPKPVGCDAASKKFAVPTYE